MSFVGTPEIKIWTKGAPSDPDSVLTLVVGDLSEPQEGFTAADMQRAHEQLKARLGDNYSIVRQKIGSGEEGITVTTHVELSDGSFLTTRILAVALGDRGLLLLRMGPAEHDDETEWVGLVASTQAAGGIPWLWIGAGVGGLLLLLLGLRASRGTPAASAPPSRDMGARFTPPPWQQNGAAPAPGGAAQPLSGSALPRPPAPEPAATSPGIPGLKSTLPASGRWGDN